MWSHALAEVPVTLQDARRVDKTATGTQNVSCACKDCLYMRSCVIAADAGAETSIYDMSPSCKSAAPRIAACTPRRSICMPFPADNRRSDMVISAAPACSSGLTAASALPSGSAAQLEQGERPPCAQTRACSAAGSTLQPPAAMQPAQPLHRNEPASGTCWRHGACAEAQA